MLENFQNFLKKIRNAPEPARRRYLLLFTGVSMALVIAFWVGYVNLIVTPVEESGTAAEAEGEDFWNVVGAGLTAVAAEVRTTLGASLSYLREKAAAENRITLKRPERNFIPESLEKIPKISLP